MKEDLQHETGQGSCVEGTLLYADRKERKFHSPDQCAGCCCKAFCHMVTALLVGPYIFLEF